MPEINRRVLRYVKRVVLSGGILVIVLASCKKTLITPAQPAEPKHHFELRFITLASATEITYSYPKDGYLLHQTDTTHQKITYINYDWIQGTPPGYPHTMSGYCYASTTDSIECQIWVDGVLKVKAKDQGYVNLLLNY